MAGQLTIDTLKASSGVLATQNGITGIAKAWVEFQGGQGNTAGVINNSFNVSSITVQGTGDYTINFTTSMPLSNYCVVGSAVHGSSSNTDMRVCTIETTATSNCRVATAYTNGIAYNVAYVMVACFS